METIADKRTSNVLLLFNLFNELIKPKQGPVSLTRCPRNYALKGRIGGHEHYSVQFIVFDPGDGRGEVSNLLVYSPTRHSGKFQDDGARFLVVARDLTDNNFGRADFTTLPNLEEISAMTEGEDKVMFLKVFASLAAVINQP